MGFPLFFMFMLAGTWLEAGTLSGFSAGNTMINGDAGGGGTLSAFSAGLASGCGDLGDCGDCNVMPDFSGCGDGSHHHSGTHTDAGCSCSEPNYNYTNGPYEPGPSASMSAEKPGLPFELYYGSIEKNLYSVSLSALVLFNSNMGISMNYDYFEERLPEGEDMMNIYSGEFVLIDSSKGILRAGLGLTGIDSVFTYSASLRLSLPITGAVSITARASAAFFKDVMIDEITIRCEVFIAERAKYFIGWRQLIRDDVNDTMIEGLQVGLGVLL